MAIAVVRFLQLFVVSMVIMAQTGGVIEVHLADPTSAPLAGARVEAVLAAGEVLQSVASGRDGVVILRNLPWTAMTLRVSADGFASETRRVTIASTVAIRLDIALRLGEAASQLTVVETEGQVEVSPEQTGTRTELGRSLVESLAQTQATRGLEQVLVTMPGFAKNANGSIHPRGAHNQMTFVIDGMPISDQLGGAFATSIDPTIVETLTLYTGNIPAEFGGKVSAVAQVTTRSGQGSGRRLGGSLSGQAGRFDTLSQSAQASGEAGGLAWSGTVLAVKSHRFLDAVSLDNVHNGGNTERAFLRMDWQVSGRDTLRWSAMGGRSSFESANLRSQQAAGMRQRQFLGDQGFAGTWVHVLDAKSTLEVNGSWRPTLARLLPSAGDTPVTAEQERTLGTGVGGVRYSRVEGRHQWRAGWDWQTFTLRENFRFRVTDSAFAADVGEFAFAGRGRGNLLSGFVSDTVKAGRWTLSLGARWDAYRFLVRGNQLQPRVGVAYHLRETNTVLRASYNRLYQTPPNENLLLSSSGGARPIQPERQNFYELGFQQGVGSWLKISGTYYHKDARDQQDNNNFFNTGVIFPVSLARIRVNGAEGRIETRERRGVTGTVSLTHYRAISTPPFTGGLFLGQDSVDVLSQGPFVIDHDQTLSVHGVLMWRGRKGWFCSASVRSDSGLVANPSDPREVAADPDYRDLLPYVKLTSKPARVRPRTIADVGVGYRRKVAERTRWELALQVNNLGGVTALYNFQSVFVGTRLVEPRAANLRWRWWF